MASCRPWVQMATLNLLNQTLTSPDLAERFPEVRPVLATVFAVAVSKFLAPLSASRGSANCQLSTQLDYALGHRSKQKTRI